MRCKFEGVYRDGAGNVVKSGTATIYLAGTTTPANVYKTATSTTAVNSLTTSSVGKYTFYVDRFEYDAEQTFKIVLSKTGYTSATYDNVAVDNPVIKTYTISTDTTVATAVEIPKGVMYSVASGKTLTFSVQPQINGDYQVFTGDGTVQLGVSNPKWFGATGDGTTDDSAYFTAAIAAIAHSDSPGTGKRFVIPPGKYKIANVVYNVSDSQIDCQGMLMPISGTTGYTILIGNATSGSGTPNIIGNIRVNSGSKGSVAGYSNVEAVRIQNLNQSNITIDQAEGCKTGVMMASDGAGCAYNNIYFGSLMSNNRTVEFSNANGGWVNENKFYGGRFGWVSNYDTGAANDAYCHIYIPYDVTHGHNGNIFISPSLEGTFQFVNVDASYNKVLMARTESSNWFANKIQFGSHGNRCEFSAVYTDNLSTNSITHADTADEDTITHSSTANTVTITGPGVDLTPYFYPGSVAIMTTEATVSTSWTPDAGDYYTAYPMTRIDSVLVDDVALTAVASKELLTANTKYYLDRGNSRVYLNYDPGASVVKTRYDNHLQVINSAYTAETDTTIIKHSRSGEYTSADTIITMKALPIYNAGSYNTIYVSRLSVTGSFDYRSQSDEALMRYLSGAMTIKHAFGTDFPLLTLISTSSSGATLFQTLDSGGALSSYIKGSGAAWFDSLTFGASGDSNGMDSNGNLWSRTSTVLNYNYGGGLKRTTAQAYASPSGTTTTFDIATNVPSGVRLVGCQLRVDTALTEGETWSAAFTGGSSTSIAGTGQDVAKNTKVNWLAVDQITSNVTNVRITRDAGNFTNDVGVIRAIVYYEELTALNNAS